MNSGDYLIPKEIYDELFSDYIELVQKEEQLQQENSRLKDKNKKVLELLQILHYNFPDYDDIHENIEDMEKILKEDNKEEN